MMRGIITPIVKNKLGDLTTSDNYRPVMSSSVFLKLLEYCILHKIESLSELNDRQHGFRSQYSTESACLVLKETISYYNNGGSDVYGCFVDIRKAFDSVNHSILVNKLVEYGIPKIYVNLVKFLYSNQMVQVRYMSEYSGEWRISNGVRQGGVLSGLFFGIYIDSLISNISRQKIGCKLGIASSNIIAYADDIVLLAPSAGGLQLLIDKAVKEAESIDLNFNLDKTKCMIFRSSGKVTGTEGTRPFRVNDIPINFVTTMKYLGYIISSTLNDSEDIIRARSKFYGEFNSVIRNFSFADRKIKLFLFRQYCLQFYGCELWSSGAYSLPAMKQFAVGYHKAIKKILNLSYHESNHYACQEAHMFTFKHFTNKCRIMSVLRFLKRPCKFFRNIMDFLFISSRFLQQVYDLSGKEYGIDSLTCNDTDAIISRISYVQNHERQMRVPC